MKKEDLIKLGLDEETAKKVAAASEEELKGYVDKETHTTKLTELQTANTTITTLQGAIKKFDGVDVEQLKKDASDWETKYNTDVANIKRDSAIDMAIMQAKGRNPKAIKALLDSNKIKLKEDGTLEGLDLEGLKKSDGYLFDVEETQTLGTGFESGGGSGGGSVAEINAQIAQAMGVITK
ncbi:phage scaffolding protein [Anaerotignum propionicum]|uniref:phage scaffolding protein n=1 Tax=Anaerotignum propionicum TaxID=28446 RepID=UPI00210C30B2|nr:phage scaffolding protein [Anaerotignum propionicum]MCQ4935023.1 phage scaffolding protein [Anaerotignum propionicum]